MSTTNFVLLVLAVVVGLPLIGGAIVIATRTRNPPAVTTVVPPRVTTSAGPAVISPTMLNAVITVCDAQSNTAVASGTVTNTIGHPASFVVTVGFSDGDTHEALGEDVATRTTVLQPNETTTWQAVTIAAPTGATLECTIRTIVEQ